MLEALEQSLGIVTTACRSVGIVRQTHYNWYRDDPEYKDAVDSIADIALDIAESELHRQIRSGEVTSTIFYLKTKGKKRGYIEKTEVDSNVNMGVTFNETKTYDPVRKADDSIGPAGG